MPLIITRFSQPSIAGQIAGAFEFVLELEGGWKYTDYDFPTYGGMTYAAFAQWCVEAKKERPSQEAFINAANVKDTDNVTQLQLRSILRDQIKDAFFDVYWRPFKFNAAEWQWNGCPNSDLILPLYSASVNQGPRTSIALLQKTIGIGIDGVVGPQTLTAIRDKPYAKKFITAWRDKYIDICTTTPAHMIYLKGWLNRIEACRYQ